MIVNMVYGLKTIFPKIKETFWNRLIIFWYRISKNNRSGLNKKKRKQKVIISFTSIPSRIDLVWITVESLLRQNYKPDKIIIWLSKEEFKNRAIPKRLKDQIHRGVEIRFCENLQSYKKIVYALKAYPEAIIVTVDDDVIYAESMLRKLIGAYVKHPDCICAHRTHIMTLKRNGKLQRYDRWIAYPKRKSLFDIPLYTNLPTGVGGILYPPHSLYKDVLNASLFMKLAPNADDLWLKIMAILNGTKTINVKGIYGNILSIVGTQEKALSKKNVLERKNDQYLKDLIEYYGIDLREIFSGEQRNYQ